MKPLYPIDMQEDLDPALRRLGEFRQDLPKMARECLKVRDKNGQLVPFIFNPIQRVMHKEVEKQKAETGMVRSIVLKYRRAGASTYILGRGYHKTSLNHGVSTSIMAHLSASTNALYRIVKRFHDNNPLAPELDTSNVKGLEFAGMDSRYSIYSSETEDAGRGDEITFLHLSEGGAVSNLEEIMSGIGNCVSDVFGTEVWIEGTAKEPFGPFFERCMDCLKGASEYKLIFVPWSMDPDLTAPPPADFEINPHRDHEAFPSEIELRDLQGLTLGQIYWRRRKMGSPRNIFRFAREYPLTISDAFNAVEDSTFISPADVQRARNANILASGSKVIGIDPASMGGDRFTIACRQGRKVLWIKHRTKVRFQEGLEWVKQVIEEEKPDRVNIDAGGGGNGDAISSALRDDRNYQEIVRAVNFGSTSQAKLRLPDKPGPKNRKAEMAWRIKEVIESVEGLDLPDTDEAQADFCAPQIRYTNQEGDFELVPKAKLKGRSHDLFDAVGLTYADEYVQPLRAQAVNVTSFNAELPVYVEGVPPRSVSWMG